MHDPAAEGVEVFSLLQHVGASEHEREAGHPELADEPLVHSSVHATHGDLPLQGVSEFCGQGCERGGSNVGEVDGKQQVERGGGLRQLVEGVKPGCLHLHLPFEQGDEVVCQRLRRAGF